MYLIVTDAGYQPACQESQEIFSKSKFGNLERWERKQVRNVGFHKKYWSMITLVAQNQEKIEYSTATQGKERIHYAAMLILRKGSFFGTDNAQFIPASISFGNMKQDDFEELYNQVLDVLLKHFVPMDKEDFERELIGFG
jgi:hypothetical protein